MATLPRMKPERFYDLVVEVAIIRPGPIVGKMVHPYLDRRAGREPVTYPHPSLEPILKRTLGVPLFQEQLLRMAMMVAGFTGGEAEELRRAMGFKRSEKRMATIEGRLRAGMAANGIAGADRGRRSCARSRRSRSTASPSRTRPASRSSPTRAPTCKAHHPAAFTCALLNNQPMGFYHPFTLVKDAQRHGVRLPPGRRDAQRLGLHARRTSAVRLGLRYVARPARGGGESGSSERAHAPFASLQDFADRTGLRRDELQRLAEVGALERVRPHPAQRAVAGGAGGAAARAARFDGAGRRAGTRSPLREMTLAERLHATWRARASPWAPIRCTCTATALAARGVRRAVRPAGAWPTGGRVRVAGAVICRQRPGTAKGFLFLTLEDETGLVNVIVRPDLYERSREVLVAEPVLEVDGVLQVARGRVGARRLRARRRSCRSFPISSRDFR